MLVLSILRRYCTTHWDLTKLRKQCIDQKQQEQPDLVREALGRQQTLLIVDNLETMEDKQEIISFLYELPPTVKVVITTRDRAMFSPIRLDQLSEEATRELIGQQIEEKQVVLTHGSLIFLPEIANRQSIDYR
jgi:hypothetical protein